ncbi:MAG: helix-turn-helix transcriptional regulator [Bacilli bacterium]|nr:helix-turn-helix transcriptional regulator [Bacilli bacterium]
MNENEIIVGNLIADARKKKKLTQQELAKLLNVSDKAVSAWETGKNYPDLGVIKNISKYLDIDLINILADKNNKNWKKVLKVFIIIIAILFVVSSFTFGI